MKKRTEKKHRLSKRTRMIVLCSILLVVLAGLAIGARYVYRILKQPETLFAEVAATSIPQETAMVPAFELPSDRISAGYESQTTPASAAAPETPASTPAPEEQKQINVLLTGIDAYEDGRTTSGSMPHTDAMMVITINFDTDTVDLITLPRDILTTAPGHYGFYKLNGVFNVGLNGKFNTSGKAGDLASGFELTCRAAEQWLGGISIPYYYGVDFKAVIDIVDAIGGIDYDVDQSFQSMSGKRTYGVGMRHLDGDAVMGYLRIRRAADGLDSSRTARQRRMMVAIFKKLKNEGKLSQIPALISAANSGIYTNASLAQTTALVNYASKLDADKIQTKAMFGDIGDVEFDWRYVYVDQQNRIDLIKEVYGIDAEPVGICTRQYERWLHKIGFATIKRLHQIEKVLAVVQEKKNAGETFTDEQISLYTDCYLDYLNLHEAYEAYSKELADIYGITPWREKQKDRNNWSDEEKQQNETLTEKETAYYDNLIDLSNQARTSLSALAKSIGYHSISWFVNELWYNDRDVNEISVAFG